MPSPLPFRSLSTLLRAGFSLASRRRRNDVGQALTEYALLVGLVAATIVALSVLFREDLGQAIERVGEHVADKAAQLDGSGGNNGNGNNGNNGNGNNGNGNGNGDGQGNGNGNGKGKGDEKGNAS